MIYALEDLLVSALDAYLVNFYFEIFEIFLILGYCVSLNTCIIPPFGFYRDFISTSCTDCNSLCSSCFGALNTQCNTCASGYLYYATGTTCSLDCPLGTYENGAICSVCHNDCDSCFGN